MSHYKDLSLYEYTSPLPNFTMLNVGWIETSSDFLRGEVSLGLVDRLLIAASPAVNLMRGYQTCLICHPDGMSDLPDKMSSPYLDVIIYLGMSEIDILGKDNIV